jgi:hypothetical protein
MSRFRPDCCEAESSFWREIPADAYIMKTVPLPGAKVFQGMCQTREQLTFECGVSRLPSHFSASGADKRIYGTDDKASCGSSFYRLSGGSQLHGFDCYG